MCVRWLKGFDKFPGCWSHSANFPTLHSALWSWAKFFWLFPSSFCYWSYYCIWSSLNLSSWNHVKDNCTQYLGLIKWNILTNPYLFLIDSGQYVCRMQLPVSHRSHLVPQSCPVNERSTWLSSTLLFPVDYFSVIILKYNFLPLTKYKNLYFVTLIFISLLLF